MDNTRKVLQLYYTSCRSGQSYQKGFQVRACSEGITAEEQQEIIAWSRYRRPDDTKAQPGVAALEHSFPVALRYYPLASGRCAITASHYAGIDHTGAPGNYFAHTLVFERDAPEHWPLDYHDWPGWKHRLRPEEDTLEQPPPLPPIEIESLRPSERLTLAQLQAFIADPARAAMLTRMLTSILLYPRIKRALVVRDTPENNLLWLACLEKALPLPHTLGLSVSTYQYDAEGAARLNATCENTGFHYREVQRGYDFFIFDLLRKEHSTVPVKDDPDAHAQTYARCAVTWLRDDPERLQALHRFATTHFTHDTVDDGLFWLLRLYQCATEATAPLRLHELLPTVAFAQSHARPEAWARLVDLFETILKRLDERPQFEHYDALLRLFLNAADSTGQSAQRSQAFTLWLAMFDSLMVEAQTDLERELDSYRELEQHFADTLDDFHRAFLSPGHTDKLATAVDDLKLEYLDALAWLVLDVSLKDERPLPTLLTTLEPFALALGRRGEAAAPSIERLMTRLAEEYHEFVGDFSIAVWDAAESEPEQHRTVIRGVLMTVFTDFIRRLPEHQVQDIRRHLEAEDMPDILFEEWCCLLAKTSDPCTLFQHYRDQILEHLPVYRLDYASRIYATLFAKLSPEQQRRQALEWLGDNEEWSRLDDELAGVCLRLANRELSLSSNTAAAETLAARIFERTEELGVDLRPHKPQLRAALRFLREDRGLADYGWFDEIKDALAGLERDEYHYFLDRALPYLLADAVDKDIHRLIVSCFPKAGDGFGDIYLEQFGRLLRRKTIAPIAAAVHFWLSTDAQYEGSLRELEPRMQELLLAALARWNEDKLAELEDEVSASLSREPYAMRQRWEAFKQRLEERRGARFDALAARLKLRFYRLFGVEAIG